MVHQEAALGFAPGTAATASDLAQGTDPNEREPIYDVDALHEKLEDIAWSEDAPWEATQVVTAEAPTHVEDADDDLQRELAFYQQVRCHVVSVVRLACGLVVGLRALFRHPDNTFCRHTHALWTRGRRTTTSTAATNISTCITPGPCCSQGGH